MTPGRAQAMVEALDIALDSGELDKRVKGVVRAMRELLAPVAPGQTLDRNPSCSVYVVPDIGTNGEQLTKIGHALDVRRRFARCTDRPMRLRVRVAWLFSSVEEAMEYEADAHHRYKDKALSGDGGVEWFKVNAEHVVDELTKKWSRRPSSGSLI